MKLIIIVLALVLLLLLNQFKVNKSETEIIEILTALKSIDETTFNDSYAIEVLCKLNSQPKECQKHLGQL